MNIKVEIISDLNPESVILLGLDEAIIGISNNFNVIYDINKIKSILKKDGLKVDEIDEFIEFNIINAYYGDYSPLFIYKL